MPDVTLLVSPQGAGFDLAAFEGQPVGPLLYALVDIAAAAVRSGMPDPNGTYQVPTSLLTADATTLTWQMGQWVLHGVDLRSIGLPTFLDRVEQSRAKAAFAAQLGAPTLAFFAYGMTIEGDVAAGYLLQGIPDKLPVRLGFYMNATAIVATWLTAFRMRIAVRGLHKEFAAALDLARRELTAHAGQTFEAAELLAELARRGFAADEGEALLMQALASGSPELESRIQALSMQLSTL